MENQDKTNFSLDDDEEIIEEEVIDRDEEYEDDDYDDEDYEDEDYDEEEDYDDDYEDEDYDDGYNDDYYDERLNKVLDEIAEIKRGMNAPSTQVQQSQPPFVPQYIYQPNAPTPSAGSEVVMYNEISRLRDELAKNSSSLEMQKEITRMKEDMARDQKLNEMQYNAEIKRLQDRIDDLLKNAESPQSEQLPAGQQDKAPRLEGGKSINFDKLISINEAVLHATRDSDARIRGEIEQLKAKLEALPTGEAIEKLAEAKAAADGAGAVSNEVLEKLVNDVEELRRAIGGASVAQAPISLKLVREGASGDISTSELLRQLYEIKTVLGSSSEDVINHTKKLLELVGEYKKVNNDVHSQSLSYRDKLNAAVAFAKKLGESNEPAAVDLVDAINALVRSLSDTPLTRSSYADLSGFCADNGITTITPAMRDDIERYFTLCDKLSSASESNIGEFLPDLVAEKNKLQNNACVAENAAMLDGIVNELTKENHSAELVQELVTKIQVLRCGAIVDLPVAELKAEAVKEGEEPESLFDKLTQLKAAMDEHKAVLDAQSAAIEAQNNAIAERPVPETKPQVDSSPLREVIADDFMAEPGAPAPQKVEVVSAPPSPEYEQALEKVYGAINALQETLKTVTDNVADAVAKTVTEKVSEVVAENAKTETVATEQPIVEQVNPDVEGAISSALDEVRSNYLDIAERLVSISERLNAPVAENVEVMSEESKNASAEDMAYIRDKLNEQEVVLSQINDLRNDILNISNTIDLTEQFNAQLDEMNTQFDKLYEDLSNVIIESETNIINKIDMSPSVEAIENAKADILADTQSIRETLLIVSDTVTNTTLNEAIDNLRADLSSFADLTAANVDVSTADRQKLLDDVAFLREQAELAMSDRERVASYSQASDTAETGAVADDKVYAYLDDIANRVGLIANISEDAAVTKDTVGVISDNVTSVLDTVTSLNENVLTVNDNVNAALDALAPISDQIAAILDRLEIANAELEQTETVEVSQDTLNEDLAELKDNLNTILDTLPLLPQSDDLVTARDNTYSILDTLTMMPKSEDVVATRDNVASVLEAVRELSDNLAGLNGNADNTLAEDVAVLRADTESLLASVPETMGEDVAIIRDNTAATVEDVAAIRESVDTTLENIEVIRQKLEGGDSLDAVVQDVTAILDKLEAFEQTAAANKQDIIDAVREKNHIDELDETMTAVGIDDATRETLVSEIAEVRERLSNIEGATQSLSDANAVTLDSINARLDELANSLAMAGDGVAPSTSSAIDEINDKLNALLENAGVQTAVAGNEPEQTAEMLDGISADIAEILARLSEQPNGGASDDIQAITDGLAVIKEKIDAQSDYDTIAEILSLREDVKAARIVDQNEVSGELESIKNELAAISSGNILDEIRALRDDIAALESAGMGGEASNPTGGEINLVLNEIVSLRDEVFALRDEVINAVAIPEDEEPAEETVEAEAEDDSVGIILDELAALRIDQNALNENVNDLKDAISRRTKIDVDEVRDGETDAEGSEKTSDELNVVLGEIINLKNEMERVGDNITADRFDEITDQVAELRELIETMHDGEVEEQPAAAAYDIEELKAYIDNLAASTSAIDIDGIAEQLDNINAAISDIKLDGAMQTGEASGSVAERFDELYADIADIKATLGAIVPQDASADIEELRAEIEQLKTENEQLRTAQNDGVAAELSELREAIRDLTLASAPAVTESGDTSYAALIDEIRALREEVALSKVPAPATLDNDAIMSLREALTEQAESNVPLSEELNEIRDEIAQLRSLATVTADSGSAMEVAAIKTELAELRDILQSPEHFYGLAEDVTSIKADVQTLKDEPDLGVMSEILALRDEFQALREEIEDVKRIAAEENKDKTDETVLAEIQSLRDQLFAISMANVNDAVSGETNYESYNNLILDEIASLQERIAAAGSSDELQAVTEEIAKLKAAIDKREELYDALAARVAKLDNDATNNKILEELDALHTELSNQREADLTTLNFMSEMAHLLERQNSYIAQNTGTKISDEIESLKAELASTDNVAEEIAKLREIVANSGAFDNDSIMNELAELREQLNSDKTSSEDERILEEIASLRNEMSVLAEQNRGGVNDGDDLSGSLNDLKSQLNEIVEIMEPAPAAKPAAKRKSTSSTKKKNSTAKKSTSSNSGSKKRGRPAGSKNKPQQPKLEQVDTATAVDTYTDITNYREEPIDLDARITEQSAKLGVDIGSDIPDTKAITDRLDRLAQRVANKLIIEQLVEQLGDDGKTDEQVERILGNLPQELTTVALDEQSEQVRKLANELAESKLRERLNKKTDEDND